MKSQFDDTVVSTPLVPDDFFIRPAVAADAEGLAGLAARTFIETYGPFNTPTNLQLYLTTSYGTELQTRELADADTATLLACDRAGEMVGFAQARRGPAPPFVSGDIPVELLRLYVDRNWHGRGVAQRLLAQARAAAREFGATTLWLKVWERNPRARAFYRKEGFTDVGIADFFVGTDRQTDRVMSRDLEQTPTFRAP